MIHVCFLCFFTVYVQGGAAARRSLQHDVLEVLLQDGVLDGVEDEADVLRVHRRREVVEQRLASVPPFAAERLHQERLDGWKEEQIQ